MTYETKDSGERAQFDSGMQRDTQTGKPRFDLTQPKGIPFDEQLLTRFALLMGRGAEKYTERNWEQASGQEELDRFLASAFRHFMQWYAGERDEDHAAAVLFNIMGYEATRYKMEHAPDAPGPLDWAPVPVDLTLTQPLNDYAPGPLAFFKQGEPDAQVEEQEAVAEPWADQWVVPVRDEDAVSIEARAALDAIMKVRGGPYGPFFIHIRPTD